MALVFFTAFVTTLHSLRREQFFTITKISYAKYIVIEMKAKLVKQNIKQQQKS